MLQGSQQLLEELLLEELPDSAQLMQKHLYDPNINTYNIQ